MRKLTIFITILFFGFFGFVKCSNMATQKEGSLDSDAEALLLLDNLTKTNELANLNGQINNLQTQLNNLNNRLGELEINGIWKDNFGSIYEIYGSTNTIVIDNIPSKGYWKSFGTRYIVTYDNIKKVLYVRTKDEPSWDSCDGDNINGESNVPCFSRINWVKVGNFYYYCEDTFNKGSFEEIKNAPYPTNYKPETPEVRGSCGGFTWSKFVQKLD
ncbi:MAG: hypothetical protein NZ853_03810 [Leptospiraceae bacterium]|nr:hypothetical protein [Leptospiraceae bacterium]MDW7975301.1 hypothetical protein [Leptospiraceae bacterium]